VSLAIDAAGTSHIGFGHGVGYGTNGGGTWEFDAVSTHLPALQGAIATTAAGVPGIAYRTTNLLPQEVGWTVLEGMTNGAATRERCRCLRTLAVPVADAGCAQ
jgi:hypothetical protein